MRNIKKIFYSDIKALLKNFFALVIAIGLCLLPALYAWFNIHSNWDPYGNTGNIKIAVASDDKGYTDANGSYTNVGEGILENLKENDSIHWVFTTSGKAQEGVKSGRYYAAVVLSEDFSECMYEGFLHNLKRPQVSYYENEKKNAVATKITDTAVSNLKNNINEMYITILVSNLFEEEHVVIDMDAEDSAVERLQKKLNRLSKNVEAYEKVVDSLIIADEKLTSSMDSAKSELEAAKAAASKQSSKMNDNSDSALGDNIVKKDTQVSKSLSSAGSNIEKAIKADSDRKKTTYYKRAVASLKDARSHINNILDSLKLVSLSNSSVSNQYNQTISILEGQLSAIDSFLKTLEKNLNSQKTSYTTQKEAMWQETFSDIESEYDDVLQPFMNSVISYLNTVNHDVSKALGSIAEDIELLNEVLTGAQNGVASADKSLKGLSDVLDGITDKLDTLNSVVSTMSNSEFVKKMKTFVQGDPEGYGAFFATPVQIETESIYPVENYGSGVTPFYTTLAIWVGGIFLVSLIKVKPGKKGLVNPKPHELFLGRFILFFLLGQIQTLIIVLGNICILRIQCLYPFRFWLAASIASFTFMLLIYSLTVSFGDVGKALVVVIVVLQIAGSSGTYPIEILPEFYQKIYIFFPFPYSINAMREAICGMYESDYVICLIQLLLFAVAALLLGLVIRLPFQKVNHFMEKRMEDTGFM